MSNPKKNKKKKLRHRKLNNDINIEVCMYIVQLYIYNIQLWTGICGLQRNCRHFYCTVEIFASVIQFLIYQAVIRKIRATRCHDEYNNSWPETSLFKLHSIQCVYECVSKCVWVWVCVRMLPFFYSMDQMKWRHQWSAAWKLNQNHEFKKKHIILLTWNILSLFAGMIFLFSIKF